MILIGMILFKSGDFIVSLNSSVETKGAEIIDKKIKTTTNHVGEGITHSKSYYLTFSIDGEGEVTLSVPRKIYRRYSAGDKGFLEYQRKIFKSFNTNK